MPPVASDQVPDLTGSYLAGWSGFTNLPLPGLATTSPSLMTSSPRTMVCVGIPVTRAPMNGESCFCCGAIPRLSWRSSSGLR